MIIEYIFTEVETLFGVYDLDFGQIRVSTLVIVVIDLCARVDMVEHVLHEFVGV